MTTFIKNSDNSLSEVGRSKIRNYATTDDVIAAIESGELKKDDLFTTIAACGLSEDVEAVIRCLVSITPNTASPTNMLVTQDQITDLDIGDLRDRIDTAEANISTNTSCINTVNNTLQQVGAQVEVNANNIDLRVCCTDFNTSMTNMGNLIQSVVDATASCTDFNNYKTSTDTNISNLNDDVDALETRVSTNESDIGNLQTCTTSLQTSLNSTSNTVSNNTTRIAALENAGYTTCKGTVTSINNTTDGNAFNPDQNGVVNMRVPVYTLSGSVLTITY